MGANRVGMWLALSWLWVLIVAAYMFWGLARESGLFAWLMEWQLRQFGQYYPKATVALPVLVIGAPGWWYISHRARIARAELRARGPAEEARRMGRDARWMALAGLAAIAVGIGAYLYAQTLPDQDAPPMPFDAATLGSVPAPAGRVRVVGDVDPAASVEVTEQSRTGNASTFYVAFRPAGETAKDAPYRLFVERHAGTAADAATTQMFLPEQEGFLVEDGLPRLARAQLERQGLRIASPHYLLSPGRETPREPFHIAAGLGGFVGFVFLLVALIGGLKARRRLRRAEAAA